VTIFRPAFEAELRSIYEVFYQNELLDNPHLPLPGTIPPYLSHVLHTGTLYVAEKDGKILAFASAITRGNISFLTDLFVLPSQQSGQLGKTGTSLKQVTILKLLFGNDGCHVLSLLSFLSGANHASPWSSRSRTALNHSRLLSVFGVSQS
jgi:hypothetical protein